MEPLASDSIKLLLTCPEEIKDLVMAEAREYSTPIRDLHKAVMVEVTEKQFYEIHLMARLPSKIFRVLQRLTSLSLKMLAKRASDLAWEEVFKQSSTFKVTAVLGERGDHAPKSNDISRAVRTGIEQRFHELGWATPRVELEEPDVEVIAYFHQGVCDISVLTSGDALHKRGYRSAHHPAPIKETLAAAAIRISEWQPDVPFWDIMTGSGTIGIEAAMIALNKPPLIHRKKGGFSFENHAYFNSQLFRKTGDDLRALKSESIRAPIICSDISEHYIHDARENALRARVEKYIDWQVVDALKAKPEQPHGVVIANLPYGFRLSAGEEEKLKTFYSDFGRHLKHAFAGWRAVLICASTAPHKFLGMKPDFKRSILNGAIETKILGFDIYAGSRKSKS